MHPGSGYMHSRGKYFLELDKMWKGHGRMIKYWLQSTNELVETEISNKVSIGKKETEKVVYAKE